MLASLTRTARVAAPAAPTASAQRATYVVQSARQAFSTPRASGAAQPDATVNKTTLSGGVTLLSADHGQAETVLSLYVRAGSRYETPQTLGAAKFLSQMAHKGNNDKFALRFSRDLEHVGATLTASANREFVHYQIRGFRAADTHISVPVMTESLRSVTNPTLEEWEVDETMKEVANMQKEDSLSQSVHYQAFGDSGLGNPMSPPSWAINSMDNRKLHQHVSNFYYPGDRMVIVATGIEHSNLLKRMEPLFADASLQGKFREVKAQEPLPAFPATSQDNAYTATPSLIRNLSPGNARFMLGLQGAGANSPEEFAALEVFREIVGGGAVKAKDSSNRASLLARNVLEKNENALQVHAFHNGYSDAGLFGVVAEAAPGQGGAVLEAVRAELEAASKNFTAEDLSRAKNILKVKAADAFSNTQGLAGFIADSYLSFGGNGNLTEYFELIDSVTEAKVKAAAKKTVSSAPVVAAEGDVRGLRL